MRLVGPFSPPGLRRALLAVLLLVSAAPAIAAPPADPREPVLAANLDLLEDLVWRHDHERALAGTYETRVWNLHVRISRLEAARRIPQGGVSRRSDITSLLADAALLGARVKGLRRVDAMQAAGGHLGLRQDVFLKPPPEPPGPAGPPPAKPAPGQWPAKLTFAATAKIGYWSEGEWFLTKMRRTGWGPDFLLTGWQGDVSFSIRARDLVKEVRSCDLRVAVKVVRPFAEMAGTWRFYDVEWKPDRSMANTSLRTWMAVERLKLDGPFEWTDGPSEGSAKLEVECHVRSVTLLDKSVVTFQFPEYIPVR